MRARIFRCLEFSLLLCLGLIVTGCGDKDGREQITEEAPMEKISDHDIEEFDEEVQRMMFK